MSIQPLATHPDLSDQAYDALVDAICCGDLQAGTRLMQEELALRLGVSRQPIVHALGRLRREGLVIDSGRRGVEVAPIDPATLASVYEIRGALDALAAGAAARADGASRSRRLADARAAIAEGRRAIAAGDGPRLIGADLAFHRALYAASGNPLIGETLDVHWRHVRRAMALDLGADRGRFDAPGEAVDPARVWDEHAAIVAAIEAGDEARAAGAARAHCGNAATRLGARLAAAGDAAPSTSSGYGAAGPGFKAIIKSDTRIHARRPE